ncbi:hypothetical protein CVT26_005396 [Gymnopilus dilepis]|uniref:Uncharacterized protein n=1 Tax=Gymnopilus dilepis TaxID=231916 RepID=A0A409WGX9_9AGAR|nr:hypothetical protein CVT26_005396 [Gymnopilus dilepis]
MAQVTTCYSDSLESSKSDREARRRMSWKKYYETHKDELRRKARERAARAKERQLLETPEEAEERRLRRLQAAAKYRQANRTEIRIRAWQRRDPDHVNEILLLIVDLEARTNTPVSRGSRPCSVHRFAWATVGVPSGTVALYCMEGRSVLAVVLCWGLRPSVPAPVEPHSDARKSVHDAVHDEQKVLLNDLTELRCPASSISHPEQRLCVKLR